MAQPVTEDELVGLSLATLFCVVALLLITRLVGRKWRLLLAAFLLTVFGRVFTVVEGIAFFNLFHLLEHVASAAAAVCLAFYCYGLRRSGLATEALEAGR